MEITATAIVELDHPANYIMASRDPLMYLVAGREGKISLLDERFSLRHTHQYQSGIDDLSIDPAWKWKALILKPGNLVVERLADSHPVWGKAGRNFETCLFAPDGKHLWCAGRISRAEIECLLLDVATWQTVARATITDEQGGFSGLLIPVPSANATVLWLADGQGSTKVIWFTFEGGQLSWRVEPLMEDAYPPVFNDSGTEFLVNHGYVVRRYAYPAVQLLGSCPCTFDEEAFEPALCFLSGKTALVRTSNGRLFTINLKTMALGEEALISGHKPKPARAFSSLPIDARLCTDIDTFRRLGRYVVMVCPPEGHSFHRDSLLFCHIEEFNS